MALELHRAGCILRDTFSTAAALLPRLVAALAELDLPSEAQLKGLVAGGHTQELVAAGATIIDAVADIYQSANLVLPPTRPPHFQSIISSLPLLLQDQQSAGYNQSHWCCQQSPGALPCFRVCTRSIHANKKCPNCAL